MASGIPKDKIERQHMKRTIILLAAFALFIVGCRRNNTIVDPGLGICVWSNGQWATDWMKAYSDYIANANLECDGIKVLDVFPLWGLAYIDDDNIPEMVLFNAGEAFGNIVLSYYDGKVSEWTSWRCNAEYIPYSGLICNRDGSMDVYWNKVIRLKDGQFSEIYNHTDIIYLVHDTIVDVDCIYNGDTNKDMGCKMDYDSILNVLFYSNGNAIKFDTSLDHLETGILEKGWQPTLPNGMRMDEYKLTLLVQ